MLNQKLNKIITNLIELKNKQQDKIRIEITNINKEKTEKLTEIYELEEKIATNSQKITLKKTTFYSNVETKIFSHKEVYSLRSDLEKLNLEYNEFNKNYKSLSNELSKINEKLEDKQKVLKALIVKEEKFKYINEVLKHSTIK